MSYVDLSYYSADQSEGMFKIPLISGKGQGTNVDPFRLTMLLRHADMGDEATLEQARTLALRTMKIMEETVLTASIETKASNNRAVEELKKALRATSLMAETDTYYSAIAAMIFGNRLIAVGIGHVNLWKWNKSNFVDLIQPTAASFTSESPEKFLLNSALGLGFDPAKIQSCDCTLEMSDYAVIAIQSVQNLTNEHLTQGEKSASDWINVLVDWFHTKPMLVAVVGIPA